MITDTVYTEGSWHLQKYDETGWNGKHVHGFDYWLVHVCYVLPGEITRYFKIIDEPCAYCGSRCPTNLQGLYNMLMYL